MTENCLRIFAKSHFYIQFRLSTDYEHFIVFMFFLLVYYNKIKNNMMYICSFERIIKSAQEREERKKW